MLNYIRENEVNKVYKCSDCGEYVNYPRSMDCEGENHSHCSPDFPKGFNSKLAEASDKNALPISY